MLLHWHRNTPLVSGASQGIGANPVPRWEPSQNGCPFSIEEPTEGLRVVYVQAVPAGPPAPSRYEGRFSHDAG